MKHVLVPIATGSEEIETVCIVDVLRRAKVTVVVASVSGDRRVVRWRRQRRRRGLSAG